MSDASRRMRTRMIAVHMIASAVITLQQTLGHAQSNNYRIFRESFFHVIQGTDLYAAYQTQFDLYKYSPAFALLFAPFAVLPYNAGLLLWNATNAATLCAALTLLLTPRAATAAMAIVLLEAIGAMQNNQSNGLCAALMIGALIGLERERPALGAGAIAGGVAVKLFPLTAGLLGLLSPRRWSHLAWCVVMGLLFALLPLVVTTPTELVAQYQSWFAVQRADATKIEMWWIGGVWERWSGTTIAHLPVQLAGVAWTLVTAWMARDRWNDAVVRRLLIASLLIFVVAFNHMAEAPTFVIAFAGIGIWWAVLPRERWRDIALVLIVLLGSVTATDIVPKQIRIDWIVRYRLKALVTVIAWCAVQVDVLRRVRAVSPLPDVPTLL